MSGKDVGRGHLAVIGGLNVSKKKTEKEKVNKPKFQFDIPAPEEEKPEKPKEVALSEKPAEEEKMVTPEVDEPKAETKKGHHLREESKESAENDGPEEQTGLVSKYKKRQPKYKTHKPLNVRIPISLRQDMDRIAKKLGHNHPSSGFIQQFTIDALTVHVEKLKKELGID